MKNSLLAGLTLAALSVVAWIPAHATITDDINPVGNVVNVEVINDEPDPLTGTLTVEAKVNGKTASSNARYSLQPGESRVIAVTFSSKVQSVENTIVNDDPDPIGGR